MKRFLILLVATLIALGVTASERNGDRILGVYKAVKDGSLSKVRISKIGENAYRAQIVWLESECYPDGRLRTDHKNPDPAKRSTPANEIVLIEKVNYVAADDEWKNGEVYDPTRGEKFKTVLDFTSERTLRVRGFVGPFSKSLYWEKIDEE